MTWTKTKTLIASLLTIMAAGTYATFGEFQAAQDPGAQAANRQTLLDAAVADPALATLVDCVCPTCNAPIECWEIASEPGFYCHKGLKYGPGLGGVDSEGNLVTCPPIARPQDTPIPCVGPDRHWGERAKVLCTEADEEAIFAALEQRTKHRKDPEPE